MNEFSFVPFPKGSPGYMLHPLMLIVCYLRDFPQKKTHGSRSVIPSKESGLA